MATVAINDGNFDNEVLKSEGPVLVDFWAAWCGPCKMIGPVLEDLSNEYSGKVKIAKLDVDQNQNTASQFGVRSIPTLILFENGKQKETIVGADPNRIKEVLKSVA
ncbi:MAG: thioredoxin [Proteobacteria bacterium]|nr:thioredoxin [Pseudomonadota bacterium]